jgi:isocitrate lyase
MHLSLRMQVAADNNTAGGMFPDQSLYPSSSGPELCRRINRTLSRADQIEHAEGDVHHYWFAPIVADAEAGFGGPLNAHELMKAYIEAGGRRSPFRGSVGVREEMRPPRWQSAHPYRRT